MTMAEVGTAELVQPPSCPLSIIAQGGTTGSLCKERPPLGGLGNTGPQLHFGDAIDLDIERPMPPRHKDQLASRRLNREEATIHVIDD